MIWWLIVIAVSVLFGLAARPKAFVSLYTEKDFVGVDFKKKNINEVLPPKTNAKYAVIGTGFVGNNIISMLLERGEEHIKAIDIVPSTKFENNPKVQLVKANVLDLESLKKHLKDVEVVYATFAVIKYWQNLAHNYKISHDINVIGTQNVIEACIANNVKYFIQTSTSYVAIGPDQTFLGITEKDGYTKQPISHYCVTKILAEKEVLKANNSKTKGGNIMHTAAIRPCSAVFGYGDVLNCTKLMYTDVLGFLPNQTMDYVYVENVAWAHLLLEEKLRTTPDKVAGEQFCISNGKALTRLQWYSTWRAMYPGMKIKMLPEFLPPILARISEFLQYIGKGKIKLGDLELLTPSTMLNCELSSSFNIEKAERLLGYKPFYNNEEAIQKTIYSYMHEKTQK